MTLHHVLVHVTAETQRHAGHADMIRELIDGTAGLLKAHDNLPAATPPGRTATASGSNGSASRRWHLTHLSKTGAPCRWTSWLAP